MAKIEMDMTEYTSIMENKKLLEDALEREKELNKEINRLKEDKLKAYEDAQNKIICETISRTEEYILNEPRPRELLERIFNSIGTRLSSYDMDRLLINTQKINYKNLFSVGIKSSKPFKTTNVIGLDEVKEVIRGDIEKQFKDEISDLKNKLSYKNLDLESRDNTIKLLEDEKQKLLSFKNISEEQEKAIKNLKNKLYNSREEFKNFKELFKSKSSLFGYKLINENLLK